MVSNNVDPSNRANVRCNHCGAVIDSSNLNCPGCGATVKRATKPSASGWTELPPIKDMARLRVGSSTCQIEGIYVPVADFNLAAGDSVYFAHHTLLWKDPQVEIKRMPLSGGFTRMLAGLPIVMTEAHGPGHIAFSRDEPGEMIALPLQHGESIDVREHLLLAATHNVHYTWFDTFVWYSTQRGNESEFHYPAGQYMDRFTALEKPGLLLLHAGGNVFVRQLAAGQTLLIKPTALVYKDRSVSMTLDVQYPTGYQWAGHRLMWLHLTGPGRVAIQSAYEPVEDEGRAISGFSSANPAIGRASWQAGAVSQSVFSRAPTATEDRAIKIDPRHARLAKLAAEALVNGQIPPLAMQRLLDAAEAEGLSAYDVRMIVKHVQSHGS
jgi:uncharacterized protein (AIM24 family)